MKPSRVEKMQTNTRAMQAVVSVRPDQVVVSLGFLPKIDGSSKFCNAIERAVIDRFKPLGEPDVKRWRGRYNLFITFNTPQPAGVEAAAAVVRSIAANLNRELDLHVFPLADSVVRINRTEGFVLVHLPNSCSEREMYFLLQQLAGTMRTLARKPVDEESTARWVISHRRTAYTVETHAQDVDLILGGWAEGFELQLVTVNEEVSSDDCALLFNSQPLTTLWPPTS